MKMMNYEKSKMGNQATDIKYKNNTGAKTVSDKYTKEYGGGKFDGGSSQGTGAFRKKGPMETA